MKAGWWDAHHLLQDLAKAISILIIVVIIILMMVLVIIINNKYFIIATFIFFLFRLQLMSRWRYFVSFSLNHYHRGIFKSGAICILCKYFINKIHKNIGLYLKLIFHCHKTALICIASLHLLQKHQLVYFLTIFLSFFYTSQTLCFCIPYY